MNLEFRSRHGPDDACIHKRLELLQAIEERFQWHPVGSVADDVCLENTHSGTTGGVLSSPSASHSENRPLPHSLSPSGVETAAFYPLIWVRDSKKKTGKTGGEIRLLYLSPTCPLVNAARHQTKPESVQLSAFQHLSSEAFLTRPMKAPDA